VRRRPALRREVESLLRAHDEAVIPARAFRAARCPSKPGATIPLQGTATLNAAAHAEVFLHDAGENAGGRIEAYIAKLPEAVRREARERIEAGLRVRQLRAQTEPPSAEREEPPPHLPGFRIESKLGEGSLGVVYAAHDEKLNRVSPSKSCAAARMNRPAAACSTRRASRRPR